MIQKVGDFAQVFNFGRGLDRIRSSLLDQFDKLLGREPQGLQIQALHHHIFGDILSPRFTAQVPTITYDFDGTFMQAVRLEAHVISHFTSAVERGGWLVERSKNF
jgi:hypothetical protein